MATYNAPTYNPAFRELPTYNAPRWNEGEITALTQRRAAPGLRAMRQQVNRVSGGNFDNPNVKRMTLRDALAGYGMGISNVMGSASSSAASEYGSKFSARSGNARNEYISQTEGAEAYNRWAGDRARINYEGQSDEARMRYAADLTNEARNYENYRLRLAGEEEQLARYRQGELEQRTARKKMREEWLNPPRTQNEQEEREWSLNQRSLDDAWTRWKKQQEYTSQKQREEEERQKNEQRMATENPAMSAYNKWKQNLAINQYKMGA